MQVGKARGSRHGVGGFRAKPSGDNPHDLFPTPPEPIRAFMDARGHELPDGLWCEPAVGPGGIISTVGKREAWATYDIREVPQHPLSDHHETADFLSLDLPPGSFDVVITNPPFYLAEEFVRKALSCSRHVVMLLRLAFMETRRREALHLEHASDVYVLSRRPSFMANGATDSCAYAWFHWHPNASRRWQILVTPETKR